MGEHRVSGLTAGLRRFPDPEHSPDPAVRQLVAALRTLEPTPLPRAHFRAELRQQLVAVTPRLVAEGMTAESPRSTAERTAAQRRPEPVRVGVAGRLSTLSLGRPVALVTAAVAVFAILLGSFVMASRNALPGDALYGLKRANESVQLSLTSGDTARGKTLLGFASNRAQEVEDLLSRSSAMAAAGGVDAGGAISAHVADLVRSTLNSADSDVRSATQLLGDQAVESHSVAPLQQLATWAPAQNQRMQQILQRLPAGSLHNRAASSQQLITAALTRGNALQAVVNCPCATALHSDALGPIPCVVCALPPSSLPTSLPTLPSLPIGTGGSTSSTPANSTGSGTDTNTATAPETVPGSSSSGRGITLPSLSLPSLSLPSLPLPSLPLPVPSGTSSCLVNLLGICIPKL